MDREKLVETIMVCLILAYTAYATTYVIHEEYMLPFHSDEWDHLTIGKEITKTGSIESIKKINPYIGVPYASYWINLESGFHLLTGILLMATGMSAIKFGVIMPTIIAFMLALNAFTLIRYLTKSTIAGLISAVFAATIKSNVTFLGPWFYVPSSLGLAYASFFLYVFLRTVKAGGTLNGFDAVFGLAYAAVGLIHPPSVTALIPVFILYLLVNPVDVKRNKKKILVAAGAGAVALAATLMVMHIPLESLANPAGFLKRYLVFTGSDYEVKIMYSYPAHLGYAVIALSVLGVYVALSSANREEWILPLAVLSLLPLAVQFYHTGKVYLSPYRRIFFYVAEMLLLAAGIGVYYVYREVLAMIKKIPGKNTVKLAADVIVLAAVVYVLTLQVQTTFANSGKLYHVIEEKDVAALEWIRDNTPQDAVIIALPGASQAVTPIAERKVVGKVRTFLRVPQNRLDDSGAFFNEGCDKREEIVRRYGVDYTFGPRVICDFTVLEHASGGAYVYKVLLE
ncbi:MAG: DUF6798 domain-containing protein [Candidatus Altiarchaeota archaeon]